MEAWQRICDIRVYARASSDGSGSEIGIECIQVNGPAAGKDHVIVKSDCITRDAAINIDGSERIDGEVQISLVDRATQSEGGVSCTTNDGIAGERDGPVIGRCCS